MCVQVARLEAQLRHSLAPPESVRPPQLPVNGGGDGIQYSLSTPVIASHQHQQLHQLQSAPAQSSATSRPSVDCSHTHQGRDQQLHRGHSTTCTMCANQATLDTLSADGHSMTPSVSTDGYIVTHSHMTGGRQNVTNSHVTGGGLDDNDEGDSYIVLPSSADSTLADRVSDIGGDRVSQ